MSRFNKFRDGMREKLGVGKKESSPTDKAKEQEQVAKGERAMKGLLERAILRYYHRRLVGEVEITHSMLIIERSLACEIDGTDGECPVVSPEGSDGDDEPDIDECDERILENGELEREEEQQSAVDDATDKDMSWAPPRVKAMVKAIGGLLNKLEQRAKCYRGQKYAENLTVSGCISVQDPMGIFGMSITCSATVPSLIESALRKEEKKKSSK